MNEAMLTGESIPVIKNALPNTKDIYNLKTDSKYTIYGGTKIIQTRTLGQPKVLGLVIKTAFITTKGCLVRDILYPKPNKFKFYRDSLIFLGAMSILVFIGFFASLKNLIDSGTVTSDIVTGFLDEITISIPPILPSCMTVGTLYAIVRLKKWKIFCISPPKINVAGRIATMVFDKTGTLTEDGLQIFGYRGISPAFSNDKKHYSFDDFREDCKDY